MGVFADEPIARGERVAIFGGDVMRIDEIDALPPHLQDLPMQIEERFVLGDRSRGSPEPADRFNHSCEPNVGFRGQLFLEAIRPIGRDEEVCFDYAMVVSPSVGSALVFSMRCRCGAPRCRRVITEEDWLRPELRRRYSGFFSQYIEDRLERLARGRRRKAGRR